MADDGLNERAETWIAAWRDAQADGDESRIDELREEGQALAVERQAAAGAEAEAPDVEATAALDEALSAVAGATDEAARSKAWAKVPVPAGPVDVVSGALDAWRVERDGDGDDLVSATPDQLARKAPAYARQLRDALFPGEGAGDDDETALMNALERAHGQGGIEAARKALRDHERAGVAVAPDAWWKTNPPAREWLVPGWLPRGRVALFSGKGGGGKSRLALQLAAALAANASMWIKPWRTTSRATAPGVPLRADDEPGEPVNVVLATWEDEADELARRLWNLGAAGPWEGPVGPDGSNPAPSAGHCARLHVADMAGAGPLWAPATGGSRHTSTMGTLTGKGRWLRRFASEKGARLLVVDPLAAAFACNENDRGLVRAFMADWDRWGRDANDGEGCAVLFVAHPPKNEGEWSGSTDWHAASRAVWTLGHEDTGTGKPVKNSKGDDTGKTEPAEAPCLKCIKSSYGPLPKDVWLQACGMGWLAAAPRAAADAHATAGGRSPKGSNQGATGPGAGNYGASGVNF